MTPQKSQKRRIEIEKQIEALKAELKIIQSQCEHLEFTFVNTGGEGYYFCPACKKAISAYKFLSPVGAVRVFA